METLLGAVLGIASAGVIIVATYLIGVYIYDKHNNIFQPKVITMAQLFWFMAGMGLMYVILR